MEPILTSVVVAAIVSGLFQLFTISNDRKKLRAKVVETVYDLELLRWHDSQHEEFRKAIINLRASAMISGADRKLIEHYIYLAAVARFASEKHSEIEKAPSEYMGAIPKELAELTQHAATNIVSSLWNPIRFRHFHADELSKMKASLNKYRAKLEKSDPTFPDDPKNLINWDINI